MGWMERVESFGGRVAIRDHGGNHTYHDLFRASERVADSLLTDRRDSGSPNGDLSEEPIPFLAPAGFSYVAALLGILRAGGIAVPLCVAHPKAELEFVLDDLQATRVVVCPSLLSNVEGIRTEKTKIVVLSDLLSRRESLADRKQPGRSSGLRAMILYTSGTTGRPKGVVHTVGSIQAQIELLVEAWEWGRDDAILHCLPLHHVHGIVNALLCCLHVGARVDFLTKFDPEVVLERFSEGESSLFMGVPTMYAKLERVWENRSGDERRGLREACGKIRLMVSGSAALPVPLLESWRSISGHFLLERYGMTEIGMALSNPLHGERRAGLVGRPLPSVEVRLWDSENERVAKEGEVGEIEVRGPGVFLEYWNLPDETRAAFHESWFRTGDVACLLEGGYRILGRSSVDVIKTGGYKVSALEIEQVMAAHPQVLECAVIGVPDDEWGERVLMAYVPRSEEEDHQPDLDDFRVWGGERLAKYKLPSRILVLSELPRNVLGKVVKPAIQDLARSAR